VPAESDAETRALRIALRDLVALSTIPAAWVGMAPATIAAGLADVLIGSLQLDFAFVRLCDPTGGAAIEVTRGNGWTACPEWLQPYVFPGRIASVQEVIPDGGDDADVRRGLVVPIGVDAQRGLVAAMCDRPGFPDEIDRLLLSVAANSAATAFQNARLIHERRCAEEALRVSEQELRISRNQLEIKVAERTAELQRSEAYLAEAQRLTHTGSWACNVRSREVIHSSEEHSRLYGFDPDRGLPSFEQLFDRIHPDDRDRALESLERACGAGTDVDMQFRVALPDGTTRYLHGVGHPVFKPSGDVAEFVGTVIDVTDRRRADEERETLRRAQADLAHVTRVTTMGELTASLAHEIKQPIAAAATDAATCLRWLGRDRPDLAEACDAASRVVKDVTRAADIISSISALFRKGPLERECVDVNAIIREMIVLLRSEATRYAIPIAIELDPDLPEVVAGRVQLQQVLMNLMLNGIDAMKDTTGVHALTIKSEADNGQVVISVSDTGVGLPRGQEDEIFRAFVTSKNQGTGMGLAISRSIVESHGGRLWAAAHSPAGATFQFSLPARIAVQS
jgi:PAS domain S-box-containing protein